MPGRKSRSKRNPKGVDKKKSSTTAVDNSACAPELELPSCTSKDSQTTGDSVKKLSQTATDVRPANLIPSAAADDDEQSEICKTKSPTSDMKYVPLFGNKRKLIENKNVDQLPGDNKEKKLKTVSSQPLTESQPAGEDHSIQCSIPVENKENSSKVQDKNNEQSSHDCKHYDDDQDDKQLNGTEGMSVHHTEDNDKNNVSSETPVHAGSTRTQNTPNLRDESAKPLEVETKSDLHSHQLPETKERTNHWDAEKSDQVQQGDEITLNGTSSPTVSVLQISEDLSHKTVQRSTSDESMDDVTNTLTTTKVFHGFIVNNAATDKTLIHEHIPEKQAHATSTSPVNIMPGIDMQALDASSVKVSQDAPVNDVMSHDAPVNDVMSHDPPANNVMSHDPPANDVMSHDPPINDVMSHDPAANDIMSHDPPINDVISHDPPAIDVISHDPPVEEVTTRDTEMQVEEIKKPSNTCESGSIVNDETTANDEMNLEDTIQTPNNSPVSEQVDMDVSGEDLAAGTSEEKTLNVLKQCVTDLQGLEEFAEWTDSQLGQLDEDMSEIPDSVSRICTKKDLPIFGHAAALAEGAQAPGEGSHLLTSVLSEVENLNKMLLRCRKQVAQMKLKSSNSAHPISKF